MAFKFLALLVLAVLFGCTLANKEQIRGTGTVELHVYAASNMWWLAISPLNDNGATSTMELQEGATAAFAPMASNPSWGYFTYSSSSGVGFTFPLTIRLTSTDGAQITTQLDQIDPDAIIDTGAQYSGSSAASPVTEAPTASPVTEAPTASPVTEAPTPSTAPESTVPTATPSSKAGGTTAPASGATSTNLCAVTPTSQEPLKMLVPLYVYPGAAWDSLVDAAGQVDIIAIINPNSGPLSTVDSAYATYMTKLSNAGIEMIGYVHTSFGARSISDVETDINTWAANYPLVTGIFFDEASSDASELSYYTQVYQYTMSKGYNQVILNPGTQPDQGYFSISTSIVVFEDAGSNLPGINFASWVTCAPNSAAKSGYKYHFAGIAHTTASGTEATYLSTFASKGVGLVYVTDGAGGCCTYNTLTSYFAQEVSAIQALN